MPKYGSFKISLVLNVSRKPVPVLKTKNKLSCDSWDRNMESESNYVQLLEEPVFFFLYFISKVAV